MCVPSVMEPDVPVAEPPCRTPPRWAHAVGLHGSTVGAGKDVAVVVEGAADDLGIRLHAFPMGTEAAAEAGVAASTVRSWRAEIPVFRAVEQLIRAGSRGISFALGCAMLEAAVPRAAAQLVQIALSQPTTARGESAKMQAIALLLGGSRLAAQRSTTSVAVSVGVARAHRRDRQAHVGS